MWFGNGKSIGEDNLSFCIVIVFVHWLRRKKPSRYPRMSKSCENLKRRCYTTMSFISRNWTSCSVCIYCLWIYVRMSNTNLRSFREEISPEWYQLDYRGSQVSLRITHHQDALQLPIELDDVYCHSDEHSPVEWGRIYMAFSSDHVLTSYGI